MNITGLVLSSTQAPQLQPSSSEAPGRTLIGEELPAQLIKATCPTAMRLSVDRCSSYLKMMWML